MLFLFVIFGRTTASNTRVRSIVHKCCFILNASLDKTLSYQSSEEILCPMEISELERLLLF